MILTSSEIDDGAVLDTDVCVIGSGPAGMSLALALAQGGRDVLMLESGDVGRDRTAQELLRGENIGRPYIPLHVCRARGFGGTSRLWAGMTRPLFAEDFEVRDWVPHSGWPVTRAAMEPFYQRASTFLEVEGGSWAAEDWSDEVRAEWDMAGLAQSGVFQLSPPTRLEEREPEVAGQARLTTIVLATVTRLGLSANGRRLEQLDVARTLGGGGFTVRPQVTVLATGGIENARILLASRDVAPQGVGNDRDLVGRYFMEHCHTDAYAVLLATGGDLGTAFYRRRVMEGQKLWGYLRVPPAVRRRERMLDLSMLLLKVPGEAGALASSVEVASRAVDDREPADSVCTYAFGTPSEQAPNPDSRVTLGTEVDALGMPRVQLDWRLTPLDKHTFDRGQALIAAAIARAGQGRVRLLLEPGGDFPSDTSGGSHHLGTTRMHADPSQGVVDAHQQVHGVAGLYVAGSSVFPTGGASNPTLTIVALSYRLADHLLGKAA